MTFLIDPPLLVAFALLSCWIGRKVQNRTNAPVGQILAWFSLCVILFTSTSLYFNLEFMDWFWQPFYPIVTSGRDLMINTGLFSIESVDTAGLIDALAVFQIAIYPIWTHLGLRLNARFVNTLSTPS
jgi:hypothetical protein